MGIIADNFKRVSVCLILGSLIFGTVGCLNKIGNWITGTDSERVGTFAPKPLIEANSFEKIDLALQLDPESKGIQEGDASFNKEHLNTNQKTLRLAHEKFYQNPLNLKLRRNRLQDRLLSASNQRCGVYTTRLRSLDARTNFLFGSITTAIAGAGAIVTGATAARSLAGIAGILTGGRAEFNQSYFSGKTIQVITDGFESIRRADYKKILKKQRLSITNYTVEAAIKDAIQYHNHCSLNDGLVHAAKSIERAENPGLDALEKALPRQKKYGSSMLPKVLRS